MNDLSSTVGLMRREFRDVHSVVSCLDHQVRRLVDGRASTIDRPGGLAACAWKMRGAQTRGNSALQVVGMSFGRVCSQSRRAVCSASTLRCSHIPRMLGIALHLIVSYSPPRI